MVTLVKKSLNTLIKEAAARKGLTVTPVITGYGHLAYRVEPGTAVYTPGDLAHKLGVPEY